MSYKLKVFLCLVLTITVVNGLRFFKSRKRKKECLVREGWNIHYMTCASKYQKCCEKGCCDRSSSDISLAYIRIFLVCALIAFILMLVYIEMWCKRKCKLYKKKNQPIHLLPNCRRDDVLENAQEMRVLCVSNDSNSFQQEILSNQLEEDESDSSYTYSSTHTTPPPPYSEVCISIPFEEDSCNCTTILGNMSSEEDCQF